MSTSKSTSKPIPPQGAELVLCVLADECVALMARLGAALREWAEALAVHPERRMEIAQEGTIAEGEQQTTPLRLERVATGE